MKKNLWLSLIIAAFLASAIFFEPSLGWKLRSALERNSGSGAGASRDVLLENEKLKTEVAELESVKSQLPGRPANYLRGIVYSAYPTNFKNELLINIGEKDGIVAGRAVIFGGVLIGKIEKVMSDTSIVETLFDGRFELAARIGSYAADALVRGGSSPSVALIPLNAYVAQGDAVYSASPDLPYGLPIGEIGAIKTSSDKLFKEAPLNFAYDINEIKTVLVEKK